MAAYPLSYVWKSEHLLHLVVVPDYILTVNAYVTKDDPFQRTGLVQLAHCKALSMSSWNSWVNLSSG